MNRCRVYLILFITILIVGCSPNSDDPIYTDCQLTRISQPGDTSFLSTRFYYNSSGLLTQIRASNYQMDFTYEPNKITKHDQGYRVEYTLGPDSLAISSNQYTESPGDPVYSVNYFYDANKYLVKEVGYLDGVLWDSTEYTITNGNTTQTRRYQHNSVVVIVNDYSYHTDLVAKLWIYTKLGGDFGYFYYPWMGRPNKNLIKRQRQGTFEMSDFQYQLDASGFISKLVYTSLDSSPPYSVEQTTEHACK